MMRKRLWYATMAMMAIMAAACSNDSANNGGDKTDPQLGDACETKADCPSNAVCRDAICTLEETNPCGNKVCEDNQACVDDICKDKCGESICTDNQTCIAGTCKENCGESGPCGETEQCIEGSCAPQCDGETCEDEKNKCTDCTESETCFEGECVDTTRICGTALCPQGQGCSNGTCVELCGDALCSSTQYCESGACIDMVACGSKDNLCKQGEVCSENQMCCPIEVMCGQNCCTENEVCDHEKCHIKCEDNAVRCETSAGDEVCCGANEICISKQCFEPKVSCSYSYACAEGEYCDEVMKTCLPEPEEKVCSYTPQGGKVEPELLWYWGGGEIPAPFTNYYNVMSSPMVGDINHDGTPEIVFNSYIDSGIWNVDDLDWEVHGIVRVLNGKTGELITSSDGQPFTIGGGQVALGNLDDDEYLEIVSCSSDYKLIAYKYKPAAQETPAHLEVMWRSNSTHYECGDSGPGIADFDGDGKPEVYGRYSVLNGKTGELIAEAGPWYPNNGMNITMADYSVAADVDGDGLQELVGGNVVYRVNVKEHKLEPLWQHAEDLDGYPALGDLNLDGKPELVVVRNQNATVMAFDAATGNPFWPQPVSFGDMAHDTLHSGGGAPTIANVDDTPEPEIAFAAFKGNVVYNAQGQRLWSRTSSDYSSGATGSTVFDFDGDGKAEVVYADEYFLRVYDGKTGETRFCTCNTSCTYWEYPVIADVNGDGHAEIVVSSNTSCSINKCPVTLSEQNGKDSCTDAFFANHGNTDYPGTHGVRVFASPDKDWVNTRKIYNQHAYSVTNVSDDGSIPAKVKSNWAIKDLNNFRLNVQPGATYLPDLIIDDISTPYACVQGMPIHFRVVNDGNSTVEKGIKIYIYASESEDGIYKKVGEAQTNDRILPKSGEYITFNYKYDSGNYIKISFLDENGLSEIRECNTGNDEKLYHIQCPIN